MVALRRRPLAAFTGSFWLCALLVALAPSSIGYQDLAAYLARQPGVSERWRDHLIASPFGTIHAATFSFARPIGTTLSEPIDARPVNFDPRSLDVKVWFGDSGSSLLRPALQVAYPSVNRRLKGNRLPSTEPAPASGGAVTLPPLQPVTAPSTRPVGRPKGARVLDAQRESLIAEAIRTFYLRPLRPKFSELVQEIARRCREEKLPAPNWRTVKARLHDVLTQLQNARR